MRVLRGATLVLSVGGLLDDRNPTSMLELGTTEAPSIRPLARPIWGVSCCVFGLRLVEPATASGVELVNLSLPPVLSSGWE